MHATTKTVSCQKSKQTVSRHTAHTQQPTALWWMNLLGLVPVFFFVCLFVVLLTADAWLEAAGLQGRCSTAERDAEKWKVAALEMIHKQVREFSSVISGQTCVNIHISIGIHMQTWLYTHTLTVMNYIAAQCELHSCCHLTESWCSFSFRFGSVQVMSTFTDHNICSAVVEMVSKGQWINTHLLTVWNSAVASLVFSWCWSSSQDSRLKLNVRSLSCLKGNFRFNPQLITTIDRLWSVWPGSCVCVQSMSSLTSV